MDSSYYKHMPSNEYWAYYRDDESVLTINSNKNCPDKRSFQRSKNEKRADRLAVTNRSLWKRPPRTIIGEPGVFYQPRDMTQAMFNWLRQPRINGGDPEHWFHRDGWEGQKILGSGGFGHAGLFTRRRPLRPGQRASIVIKNVKVSRWDIQPNEPWNQDIIEGEGAAKDNSSLYNEEENDEENEEENEEDNEDNQDNDGGPNLGHELSYLYILRGLEGGERVPSRHIVNVITHPNEDLDLPLLRENRPTNLEIRKKTWYAMELCENGSLESVLERRAANKRILERADEDQEEDMVEAGAPIDYDEAELWAIFSCLVKGLSMMDHGHEEDKVVWNGPPMPIIHFDLKPENILLGGYDDGHGRHCIHKIHDFGLACQIPANADFEYLRLQRGRGTQGYYAPEQFTERWEYNNPMADEVAGKYSTQTNIWGIAAIMWQLAMLSGPPPPKSFFMKYRDDRVVRAGGLTYGKRLLERHIYSKELKRLIWQCLHEKPNSRPTLEDLRARVDAGKRASAWRGGPNVCSESPQPLAERFDPLNDPRDEPDGALRGLGDPPVGVDEAPENSPNSVVDLDQEAEDEANANVRLVRRQPWRRARENPVVPPPPPPSSSGASSSSSSSSSPPPSEWEPLSSSEDEEYRSPPRKRRRRR